MYVCLSAGNAKCYLNNIIKRTYANFPNASNGAITMQTG